jgi:heat shock protein HslJ
MKKINVLLLACAVLFAACATTQKKTKETAMNNASSASPTGPQELIGTYWKLIELMGKPVTDAENRRAAYIYFREPNMMSSSGGCNTINGPYEVMPGNRIKFSENLASTMMACPDQQMETDFKRVLAQADNYAIADNKLSLNKARMAPLARFVKGEAPKP